MQRYGHARAAAPQMFPFSRTHSDVFGFRALSSESEQSARKASQSVGEEPEQRAEDVDSESDEEEGAAADETS